MFLRTVKMLKATSHAKTKIKTRPGSLLTGRVFIFGFIRRQPYICRHFSVCKWAWQTSLGACSQDVFLFLILYGDSRTFAGTLVSANGHGNLFCTLFPILYRCHVIRLFEQAVKMLHILITNIGCNGLHRLVGLL